MQSSLVEYDFRVTDLFLDLQDGVRLCRAIQLLLDESSMLMVVILLFVVSCQFLKVDRNVV